MTADFWSLQLRARGGAGSYVDKEISIRKRNRPDDKSIPAFFCRFESGFPISSLKRARCFRKYKSAFKGSDLFLKPVHIYFEGIF